VVAARLFDDGRVLAGVQAAAGCAGARADAGSLDPGCAPCRWGGYGSQARGRSNKELVSWHFKHSNSALS
jgi:hypothetical protein